MANDAGFVFKMDEAAFGRVPRAAVAIAKHPGRKHPVRTQAYYKCVEESDSDSAASWKDAVIALAKHPCGKHPGRTTKVYI